MNREIIDVSQKNAEVSQSVASLRLVVERIYVEVSQVSQEVSQMRSEINLVISTCYVEVSQVSQILLKKGLFWHSGY